ncbi:uncharacterized protein [Ptychodera flava]|uniref:uncharacterized protein n=1 Tax=Ptychodera flava TaxID=63121 RepID=UPI00396AA52F
MSSEPFLSETQPTTTSGEQDAARSQSRTSLRLELSAIDTTSATSESKSQRSRRSSVPSIPSTPCTPVSAIHAQHMSEIVYEEMREKQKKYRIIAGVIFSISLVLLIFGLTAVILGAGNKINVWAIAVGSFCLLLAVTLFFVGLGLCYKITRLMDQTRQLACSEHIERSSTHTYTHFQIAPSPMILRSLLTSVKRDFQSKKTTDDNLSNKIHRVSLNGTVEDDNRQRGETNRQSSASPSSPSNNVKNHTAQQRDSKQLGNTSLSSLEEIQRSGSHSSTARPQSSAQRSSPPTQDIQVEIEMSVPAKERK